MTVELTPQGTRGRPWPKGPVARFLFGVNSALYRLFRGRGMQRMLLLTTVGARSGQRRTSPLRWFPDTDDSWIIVASQGGDARHPGWYVNLARHPDQVWIEIGGRTVQVAPQSLAGEERAEAWKRIVADTPAFAGYQEHTDRTIPVIRLRTA